MARVVTIGGSGTGKSYYTGYLLEQTVPNFDTAIHFDLEDEERGLSAAGYDPLYRTLTVNEERAGTLNYRRVLYKYRKIRVVPDALSVEETRELYAHLCETAMWMGEEIGETCMVSCDEAHNVVAKNALDDRVERLITGGRKHGVECVHISQRPQLLPTTLLSQCDLAVYFRVTEDNDLAKINNSSGINAERLRTLEDRVCLVENRKTGDVAEIDTDGVDRKRPHVAGDDGIVDEALPV